MAVTTTRPCEYCDTLVTKTATQQSQRKYWTCGTSCANKLRIRLGHVPSSWRDNPDRGKQETRACVTCGKPVTRYLSQIRTTQAWSCSKSCAAIAKGKRERAAGTWKQPKKPQRGDMVPCKVCGTEFYRQPAYIKQGRKFCSRACNAIGQSKERIIKVCALDGCEKELSLRPSYGAVRYCSRAHKALSTIERPTGRIHNGKPVKQDARGYVYLWEPDHPNKSMKGWQAEHRLVMEKALGRYLLTEEQVDHRNQIKSDNRVENLQVLDASTHAKKTNSENLGAVKTLRSEIAALQAKLAALEPSTD